MQRAALMDGMNKAIASIPAYIELCTLFVIFTPNCAHADRCDERGVRSKLSLASWRRRGWCRTEFLGARPAITLGWRHGRRPMTPADVRRRQATPD